MAIFADDVEGCHSTIRAMAQQRQALFERVSDLEIQLDAALTDLERLKDQLSEYEKGETHEK